MPPKLFSKVEKAVAEHNYSSVSEFFRDAIRAWEEDQIIKSLKQSQIEARAGKTKVLRSLRDLR
ncbi:hypothetical protein A2914_02870 [Candidatus Nomurabacteria bacterium RIFCSPLOWO2_01_FULL_41_21]|uniref:Uncharacterized protein n=2 Tax=Candidatus Nomuraibacteriota TaxID=1752729 RepID=A0A1F6V3X3_9BACT|nr:MAG: hypothetical protein A2733_00995 [Candidatus Nomurabacteria bacterium RIFCSPHIGHO2_01_FULL_40_20]OGI88875.1 MAG: hypothetical protein A2914_02870 [Candidatus Nomurabacteria bacterium RIFCSPLOWO2_01_FULL_41_21]